MDWLDWGIVKTVLLAAVGVYEIIARLFPTVGDWTVIGNIFKFLKKLSDLLNNFKK